MSAPFSSAVDSVSRATFLFDKALSPVTVFVSRNRERVSYALLFASAAATLLAFFPSLQKDLGGLALSLLLFLLFLSPVSQITGSAFFRTIMPFRKEVGILMGVVATVHAGLVFPASGAPFSMALTKDFWISPDNFPNALGFGLAALFLTLALTVTSNRFSMRTLGKNWKKLHRFAYLILVLVYVHVSLLTGDWAEAVAVLSVYAALRIAASKGVKIPAFRE